jgi:hypothetical protein
MVVIIDRCRDCAHYVVEHGSIVICDFGGTGAARDLFEASWGPACVTDCPSGPVDTADGNEECAATPR